MPGNREPSNPAPAPSPGDLCRGKDRVRPGSANPRQCSFNSNNSEYVRDFREGLGDYAFHWNEIIDQKDLGNCSKVIVRRPGGTKLVTKKALISPTSQINRAMSCNFSGYIENLNNNQGTSCFADGKYDGYSSFWDQDPLAEPSNCK
jgi:hypothetical protein